MRINKIEFENVDERGWFRQVTSGPWKQMNVSLTKKGYVRGGHFHRITKECFYILDGEVELQVNNVQTGEQSTYRFQKGDSFIIEPYENHTLTALSDTLMIALLSKQFRPEDTDIFEP